MTKKEKVNFIVEKLSKLYPEIPIPLNHSDEYTLLIAVLLSAQSTDKRVNEISPILFSRANNPKDMIKLSTSEIRKIIKPIGLSPSKSVAINKLSKILIDKYNGNVPRTLEELEELPGVGHKTASVVMSQAFGFQTFPVDTHIHRLMFRWGLSNGKNVKITELDAKRLFPKNKWNDLHLQIIYYGREYSPARGWSKEKDFITMKVGRKSFLKKMI
ncbi:MAG: endonuclease III domain-containing protein [Flavobacteriaceae bacterium]